MPVHPGAGTEPPNSTWKFRGSSKWGYKSLIWVISIVTLLITLLRTTHEPPSRFKKIP